MTIDHCVLYDSQVAVRAEDGIRDLKIRRMGIGGGVGKRLVSAGGGTGPGYENVGQYEAPPFERVLDAGLSR